MKKGLIALVMGSPLLAVGQTAATPPDAVKPPAEPVTLQRQVGGIPLNEAAAALESGTVPEIRITRPGGGAVTASSGTARKAAVPAGFAVREVPLSATAQRALAASRPWLTNTNPPAVGNNGRVLYTFGAGLPEIVCAPLRICTVELQPGEVVQGEPQIGDSVRWLVTPGVSGNGAGRTELLVIKPTSTGLDTNLVVTTDRRTYYMRLVSKPRDYMARVAFTYPDDQRRAWAEHIAQRQAQEQTRIEPLAGGGIESLSFAYKIEGDQGLQPLRVFDDGVKTYIQMDAGIKHRELPALMLTGPDGSDELVNYRVKDSMYIVDRLFDRAALLLGVGKGQRKVTITKAGAAAVQARWQPNEGMYPAAGESSGGGMWGQ